MNKKWNHDGNRVLSNTNCAFPNQMWALNVQKSPGAFLKHLGLVGESRRILAGDIFFKSTSTFKITTKNLNRHRLSFLYHKIKMWWYYLVYLLLICLSVLILSPTYCYIFLLSSSLLSLCDSALSFSPFGNNNTSSHV